jgi:hypothetical protein
MSSHDLPNYPTVGKIAYNAFSLLVRYGEHTRDSMPRGVMAVRPVEFRDYVYSPLFLFR